MTTLPVRLARSVMWLVLTLLVLAAIAISALRFLLPQLNDYREPIRQWASAQAGMSLAVDHVEGQWRNLEPSLTLKGVSVNLPDAPQSLVAIGDVSMRLDMLGSLLSLSPVFTDLRIDRLSLDLTRLSGFGDGNTNTADEPAETTQLATIRRLEELLFVQLGQFSLRNSEITLMSPADERITIAIESLKWVTLNNRHRAEGVISVADTHFSQMTVMANLSAKQHLSELSGQIYLRARNLSLTPWLNKKVLTQTNVTGSNINAELWLEMADGKPSGSLLQLDDSYLRWQSGKQSHTFKITKGRVGLKPAALANGTSGWRVDTNQLALSTDGKTWPAFELAASWHEGQWQAAISQLSLARLRPFAEFIPDGKETVAMLGQLQPRGLVKDIRLSGNGVQDPRFSFRLDQVGINSWDLVPGMGKLNAEVAGELKGGRAVLSMADDTLPYSEVFQAPLKIKQGDITAYWQLDKQGWRLWSDHLAVATPDLKVDGQFRIDFPADAPAWLSFYGEASAYKVGETWRYLPAPALGQELTDYLSAAIQGGKAEHAKLLWYGELEDYPYQNHDGIFQADVPLRGGKFSFDTAWPDLTDLSLDLLFENDWMYLDASHAKTMGATASRVTGGAELGENGHLKLTVDVAADGEQVRDYMLATPLVDSVGAALTTVQVSGPVSSRFKLDIPFDGSDVRAWGDATLSGNAVVLDAPPIPLDNVSGKIVFDNDVVKADGLKASMLEQPIELGFSGRSVADGYRVDVDFGGNWQAEKLQAQLDDPLLAYVRGLSRWQSKVGVDLHDTGFDYQVAADADLTQISSQLPYPLSHVAGTPQRLSLAVTGNKQQLTGKLITKDVAYQGIFNLQGERIVIEGSELAVGKSTLLPTRGGVHGVDIDSERLEGDRWIALAGEIHDKVDTGISSGTHSAFPELPLPTRVKASVRQLVLAGLDWNRVALNISQQHGRWDIAVDGRELKGRASGTKGRPWNINIASLHLNLPALEQQDSSKYQPQRDITLPTEFDRSMMANMPELDVQVHDAWLQGYKLGSVSGKLRRGVDMLELQNFTVDSGSTVLNLDGHWSLRGDRSETQIAFDIEGDNSSDLMVRFGINGGIQGAEFSSYASIQWQGTPWSVHRETLSGELKSETGKGVISDIGGAGRLLGLFSIDSIVRKMKLDFSGIFDDGLAFDYIRGSGRIENGQFYTDDIKMQALAGDMFIRGSANLVDETVDAKVKFIPDFTSGIPVLTAFAVAPQTAIYVFAISTALSPVLDVFTQVNYIVKGPIESPSVTEQSRFTGEFKVPDSMKSKETGKE